SSSWLASVALIRLSRQLPIAERTSISRSAEGRSWPSSRTPCPSVHIIHVGGPAVSQPTGCDGSGGPAAALAPKLDAGSRRLDVLSVEQETTVKKPVCVAGQNAHVRDPGPGGLIRGLTGFGRGLCDAGAHGRLRAPRPHPRQLRRCRREVRGRLPRR